MKSTEIGLDLKGTSKCASFILRRTARAVANLYELALTPAGLNTTGFTILVAVAKAEPVAMGVLAKTVGVDATTMSRNLRLLEKEGLVSISARSSHRQCLVTLHPQGRDTLKRSIPRWRKVQQEFLRAVRPESWRALGKALDQISAAASELKRSTERSRR